MELIEKENRLRDGTAVKDMTVGSTWKLMTSFALPIFLSHVFQQLYSTADSLIVGKFLGTESLAAVSSSGPLIFLMISFFSGVAIGSGVVISKYFGAKDIDKLEKSVHTNIALGVVGGVLITVIGVFVSPTLLEIMKTDKDVLPEAIQYFTVYFSGSVFVIIYNFSTGIMNAVGNSRRPLYYLIISSILNIILDLIFIGVFKWGVWSAALATVISQAVSAVLCMVYLCSCNEIFRVNPGKVRLYKEVVGEILRSGLPTGLQNSVIAIANVIVQSNINSFGKEATAAFGAHSKIEGFAFLPITSFSMAITTFIGQNIGAGKYDRVKKGAVFGIVAAVIIASVIGVIFYIFAPQLIGMFSDKSNVIAYGVRQARTEALFFGLLAYSHAVAAVCRGAGRAFVPMMVMFSSWCALRVVYITVMMYFFNSIELIYWAYPMTWGVSGIIYFLYYKFSNWQYGVAGKERL